MISLIAPIVYHLCMSIVGLKTGDAHDDGKNRRSKKEKRARYIEELKDKKVACLVSLAVSLYGPYVYMTKGVWNETYLCLMPWVILLLLFILTEEVI